MLVCAFLVAHLHARPRVQRAPGFPCALCPWRDKVHAHLGRLAPRDRARLPVGCLKIESDVRTSASWTVLAGSVAGGRQKWHDQIADRRGDAARSTTSLHDPVPAVPFEGAAGLSVGEDGSA